MSRIFAEWLPICVAAVVVGGSLVLGALRSLFVYKCPKWLRTCFIVFVIAGLSGAITGALFSLPAWLLPLSVIITIGPLSMWIIGKSATYSGPPSGLLQGPRAVEMAEDVLDSIARSVVLDWTEGLEED
jgi:hypothetical protein